MSDTRRPLESIDPTVCLAISPASFSKAQTAAQVLEHVTLYPAQAPAGCTKRDTVKHPRTGEVFSLFEYACKHAIEFTVNGLGNSVGTLAEIQRIFPDTKYLVVYPNKGNGLLLIEYRDGAFIVVDGFGTGLEQFGGPAAHRPAAARQQGGQG